MVSREPAILKVTRKQKSNGPNSDSDSDSEESDDEVEEEDETENVQPQGAEVVIDRFVPAEMFVLESLHLHDVLADTTSVSAATATEKAAEPASSSSKEPIDIWDMKDVLFEY